MLYKDTHNNLAYVAKPYRFHTKTRDFKLILRSYEKLNLTLVFYIIEFEPVHEISNNLVGATSKASDQPAHTRSLIRAFASRLSIL